MDIQTFKMYATWGQLRQILKGEERSTFAYTRFMIFNLAFKRADRIQTTDDF